MNNPFRLITLIFFALFFTMTMKGQQPYACIYHSRTTNIELKSEKEIYIKAEDEKDLKGKVYFNILYGRNLHYIKIISISENDQKIVYDPPYNHPYFSSIYKALVEYFNENVIYKSEEGIMYSINFIFEYKTLPISSSKSSDFEKKYNK